MADNTTLNTGSGGDIIRDILKSGVKTQVVTLDVGGAGAETLVAGTVPVSGTVTANATLSAETTKVIGTVNVASAQTIAVTQATASNLKTAATLDAETTKVIGTVNISANQTLATLTGITNALPAGTNLLGKVGIDQTTPGTTNAVAATLAAETTKVIGTVNISASQAVGDIAYTQVADQHIAYTGTAGTSAAVNASTTQMIITCTTDAFILIGSAPTATTSNMFLPAFAPSPPMKATGGTTKVSAIQSSSAGTMHISELSQ